MRTPRLLAAGVALLLTANTVTAAGPPRDVVQFWNARVEAVGAEQVSLALRLVAGRPDDDLVVSVAVPTPELKAAVRDFARGDFVRGEYEPGGRATLRAVAVETRPVRWEERAVAAAVVAAVILGFGLAVTRGRIADLLVGEDNRYSKSKFQLAVWFFVVVVAYGSALALRGRHSDGELVGGVNIPQNLLLLSGLSALTFATAKVMTKSNVDAAVRAGQRPGVPTKTVASAARGAVAVPQAIDPATEAKIAGADQPRFVHDLVRDDHGRADLGDFQAVVISLLAAGVYAVTAYTFLGTLELRRVVALPDVDTALLALFGLGQGAYLGKKLS